MTDTDFYEKLDGSPTGTTKVGGRVLLHNNSGKWHLCKKGQRNVRYACGSSTPPDPTIDLSHHHSDYYKDQYDDYCHVLTPRETMEKPLCQNCERIMQNKCDYEQVVIAVDPNESMGVVVDRFIERVNEILK